MLECHGKVTLVPRERDECHQHVAIRRVLAVRLFEERHCLAAAPLEFSATA